MRRTAEITLTENSTAGSPPKVFARQSVEITHEADTVVRSVDGHVARGRHPSTVVWFGGSLKDLEGVTNVKVVTDRGEILIDGELNTFQGGPNEIAEGVRFFVLEPEQE